MEREDPEILDQSPSREFRSGGVAGVGESEGERTVGLESCTGCKYSRNSRTGQADETTSL